MPLERSTLAHTPATAAQAGKLIEQVGHVNSLKMQFLLGGLASDFAQIDMERTTRFDFCRKLEIPLPFSCCGMREEFDEKAPEIEVDTTSSIEELWERSCLLRGWNDDPIFLAQLIDTPTVKKFQPLLVDVSTPSETYMFTYRNLAKYHLVPVSMRELLCYIIAKGGIIPDSHRYRSEWYLCGLNKFRPAHFFHLIAIKCRSEQFQSIHEHNLSSREINSEERSDNYWESTRRFLVRRMTYGEILERLEPQATK